MHGGIDKAALNSENVDAVKAGLVNLGRHLENIGKFAAAGL